MEIQKIQIFQIKVNDGRRAASPETIHELAASISKVGLMCPITLDKDYTLIAGLHRMEAVKLLGWTEIECIVSDLEGLMAELAEIDENFVRKGLSEIDYGDLLLRRKEIYEALHPQTRHGMRNGQTSKDCNLQSLEAKAFIQETADLFGVDKSTIARQIQTAKNMIPEAKAIIRGSDIKVTKQNALKLSRLPPEQQEEAATQLVTKAIRSIDDYRPALVDSDKEMGQDSETSLNENQASKPPTPPPETTIPPAVEIDCYPTIRDSVADLKNPDKDRSPTPDIFLITFTLFLQRFGQSVKSYAVNESAAVFPALTRKHLAQIRQEMSSVHRALDNLYKIMERKSKK